ncbi:hypothetical protein BD311DRAFT_805344 [Dichomitus squalens]|uniref:Uncharacterized protein n=1 Tax=Dichomitus squalens TaxID=114155 RepID=A0A4Q9MVI9_9APHY|nr:hypothetical protein BD311DRAFT_805344 [Dichomitus squalens]
MSASPSNPGQYAQHSPTGEYVQKQSIPKSVARAIPKHDAERANARRRLLLRALKKAKAACPPFTTVPLPATTKAEVDDGRLRRLRLLLLPQKRSLMPYTPSKSD